jgi:hypothetical protein
MKLAVRGDSARQDPGQPGRGNSVSEREPIVVRGNRQLRESVGVVETRGNKVLIRTSPHAGGELQGSKGASKGVPAFREGNTLKGDPRNGCGTK